MNQVHVIIGKRRRSYSSLNSAIRDVRFNLLCGIALSWIERESLEICKAIFLLR